MALKYRVFDQLLHFASTPRSRATLTLAAVSFAVCHLVAIGTLPPAGITADSDLEIPRQMIHFAAEFCRFVLPLGFMLAGFASRARTTRINQPKR
jgi:hypothetical protein